MVTNVQDKLILFEVPRLTQDGNSAIFRIISIPGKRNYPGNYILDGVTYDIKGNDRRILIEIKTATLKNNFVFTVPDQERLWEEVFNIWVLPNEKYRYAKRFFKLIRDKLLQSGMSLD